MERTRNTRGAAAKFRLEDSGSSGADAALDVDSRGRKGPRGPTKANGSSMPLHRLLLVPLAICAVLSLSACGDDGGKVGAGGAGGAAGAAGMSGGGVGGGAGNGGAAGMGPDCAHIDYASYASGDSVSFR